MHAVEITSFLDERISELAKNRLPEEPGYPSGEPHYASFMMPRDEMIMSDKDPEKLSSANHRSNGHPSSENWSDDRKPQYDGLGGSKNGYPPTVGMRLTM